MPRLALALAALTLAAAAHASGGAAPAGGPDAARTYRIVTDGSTAALKRGEKGKVVVAIEPLEKGVHVNREFPLRYRLQASPGLALAKGEVVRADAVDPAAENPRFEVAFTASAAGAQQVTVQMRFAICSDTWCIPQQRTVTVPVDVR
jgi:hypothetical protein